MNYMVYTWKMKDGKRTTEFHEFNELEDAKEYADFKADQCRKYGYEFDVRIYELTNY